MIPPREVNPVAWVAWVTVERDSSEGAPVQAGGGSPDTGRLFRSLHAQGISSRDAIPALDLDEVVTLRSVSLRPVDPYVETAAASAPDTEPFAALFREDGPPEVAPPDANLDTTYVERTDPGGFRAPVAVAIVIIATVLMGFADTIVTGSIGLITGLSLVAVSAYAAIGIRLTDAFWAVVAPPIAIFLAVISAGQWSLAPGGGFIVRQGVLIPFTLGRNAPWIIGAVVVSGAIVLIRRRRALRAD